MTSIVDATVVQPHRILIEACLITTYDGKRSFDLRPLVSEMNLYTSIFNNFLSCDLTINDAGSVISQWPIIGEEKVQLIFKSDYVGYQKIELKLRVVAVEQLNIINSRNEIFVLRLVSDESARDAKIRLRRAYVNKTVSDIVADVVNGKSETDDMRLNSKDWSNRKLITKTETDGTRDIIAPNVPPSKFLNFLCGQAKAKDTTDHSSLYFFFEDQSGFHFTTAHALVKKAKPKDQYIFMDKNTGAPASQNEPGRGGTKSSKPYEQTKINAFRIDSLYDWEKNLANGMLANKVITLDPQYSIVKEYVHNYFADFDKFPKTTGALGYRKISDKFIYSINDGSTDLRVIQTNLSHKGNYAGNFMNHDEKIPAMVAQYDILKDIVVTIEIPGDSDRAPGDLIRILVPELGSTDDSKKKAHRLFNGEYLVTTVRHIFNPKDGYQTVLQCCKTVYESEIAPTQ
jgi:hypothetical protein